MQRIWIAVFATSLALAQTPATVAPAFEAATIRLAKPFAQAFAEGALMGVEIGAGRVRIGQAPIAKLICMAYSCINRDQLVIPNWLDNDFRTFDVEATLPPGATADQVPLMLQALLADRFKLTVRKGSHEIDTYALLVGKDGLKIQKQKSLNEPGSPSTSEATVTQGEKGGTTQVLKTMHGATRITNVPGVITRVEASSIGGLVDALSSPSSMLQGVPIVDKTGLKDQFDIKMEILLAEMSSALKKAGPPEAPATPNAATAKAFLAALAEFDAAHDDLMRAPALAAVETLGLRLEPQKNQVETIIVELIERTPTEN